MDFDAAVDASIAAGRQITGVDLPASVVFVFRSVDTDVRRRVDRASALELVAASRARVQVSVAGTYEGRTVIDLFVTPMMAAAHPFEVGGVRLGGARRRDDGTIDWDAPITRQELETNGRAAIDACIS